MIELHYEAWLVKFSTEAGEVCMQIVGVVSDWCLIDSPLNAVSLWEFHYTLLLEILFVEKIIASTAKFDGEFLVIH